MGETEHMRIPAGPVAVHLVVQQKHGAFLRAEFLFQVQELSPVAKRRLGQQTKFRQRIEDNPGGFYPADFVQQQLGHLR